MKTSPNAFVQLSNIRIFTSLQNLFGVTKACFKVFANQWFVNCDCFVFML